MLKRKEKSQNDIIGIVIKPFLVIGFVVMLVFGLVYYLPYALITKISKKENKYINLKGFVDSLKSVVFSNAIQNHTDVYRQRNKVKKSRKQSAEYYSRPKGRMYISSRQEALDMQKDIGEKQKSYFFRRLLAYASIFFLKEEIRKEKAIEIDQKYPPKKEKQKEFTPSYNAARTVDKYPTVQKVEYSIDNEPEEEIISPRKSLIQKRIMIGSLSVIVACAVIFVGALAYAQELPASLNFISPKPTANLFETTVPVPEEEYCEVLPDSELFMEYTEATAVPEVSLNVNNDVDLNVNASNDNETTISGNITTEPKIYREGDTDPEIINIQKRLMELHYMKDDDATDYYGKNTVYAMERFQRQHNLQSDGTTGAETLEILYSTQAQEYKVEEGVEGSDVKEIQQRLYDLDYLSSSTYVTGYFGTITKSAVKSFQSVNGLSSDGVVGHYTYSKLFSSSAKKKPYTPTPTPVPDDDDDDDDGDDDDCDYYLGLEGNGSASDIVATAKSLMNHGFTYKWGKKHPKYGGFDCSGFVYYVLNRAGISTGYRDSSAWASTSSFTKIENMSDLQPGDVCVFKGHVGIYVGNMQMIHCTSWSGGSGILISSIDTNYRHENWICGHRIVD